VNAVAPLQRSRHASNRSTATRADARIETLVRALCIQWFGTDGSVIPDLIDVRLTYPTGRRFAQGPAIAFGRVVGRARGRDTGARLGEGIVLVQGRIGSSGSWKNWETYIEPETMILMHDVPRSLVESGSPDKSVVEIIPRENHYQGEVTQLLSERDRLLARVAEIDANLSTASAAIVVGRGRSPRFDPSGLVRHLPSGRRCSPLPRARRAGIPQL